MCVTTIHFDGCKPKYIREYFYSCENLNTSIRYYALKIFNISFVCSSVDVTRIPFLQTVRRTVWSDTSFNMDCCLCTTRLHPPPTHQWHMHMTKRAWTGLLSTALRFWLPSRASQGNSERQIAWVLTSFSPGTSHQTHDRLISVACSWCVGSENEHTWKKDRWHAYFTITRRHYNVNPHCLSGIWSCW
jgi:hypothetical protein